MGLTNSRDSRYGNGTAHRQVKEEKHQDLVNDGMLRVWEREG